MESSGLPPPAAISKVPEVKMVSTSKTPSDSAPSFESSVGSVSSVEVSVSDEFVTTSDDSSSVSSVSASAVPVSVSYTHLRAHETG